MDIDSYSIIPMIAIHMLSIIIRQEDRYNSRSYIQYIHVILHVYCMYIIILSVDMSIILDSSLIAHQLFYCFSHIMIV